MPTLARVMTLLLMLALTSVTKNVVAVAEQAKNSGSSSKEQAEDVVATKAEAKAKNAADSYMTSRYYVHQWVRLPTLRGVDLQGKPVTQKPLKGLIEVVVFVASWCIQCQELSAYVTNLQKKYRDLNTRFTYIFSHDLREDALGFAKNYNISQGIIASHDILKAYHNPELPSLYLSDRHGWLLARFPQATPKDLKTIDSMLALLTSY